MNCFRTQITCAKLVFSSSATKPTSVDWVFIGDCTYPRYREIMDNFLGKKRLFSRLRMFNSIARRILSKNPLLATLQYKSIFWENISPPKNSERVTQTRKLSRFKHLCISEAGQPFIDKYKNPSHLNERRGWAEYQSCRQSIMPIGCFPVLSCW